MKRLALVLTLMLAAVPAFAQRGNIYSTKAQAEFAKALTEGVLFGVPRYTTVALPLCDATQVGAVAWNTTTGSMYGCDGATWAAVGGGGGFTGGTVPNPTTFSSAVTFSGAIAVNAASTLGASGKFLSSNEGTAAAPVYGINGSSVRGLYSTSSGQFNGNLFAQANNPVAAFCLSCGAGTGMWNRSDGQFGWGGDTALNSTTSDTGLARDSAGVVRVTTAAGGANGSLRVADGTKTAPSLFGTSSTTVGEAFGTTFVDDVAGSLVIFRRSSSVGPYTSSNLQLGWSSGTDGSLAGPDTGFKRAAAAVVATTNGGAGLGWLQQSAGELALNANYTNATTSLTNTNLSATVISGRTYSFDANLLVSETTAASGMILDFGGGSAGATNFRVSCAMFSDTGTAVTWTLATTTGLTSVLTVPTLASTANHLVECRGTFVPSGAGTFIVRAGLNSAVGTLTVNRGSVLNIRDANPL